MFAFIPGFQTRGFPAHFYNAGVFGRIEAIQSGLYYGNAGAIKEFCYLYQKSIFKGEKPFIIGTGGFSRIFEEYNLFNEICPELVLLGVKKAVEMNQ